MVSWRWVPQRCEAVARSSKRDGEHTVPVCVGAPGLFHLCVHGACTLMLTQESGDATPSFTSRVLQQGVTPEDEEILKWTSFSMYLGMASKYSSQTYYTYVERGSMVYQVDLIR